MILIYGRLVFLVACIAAVSIAAVSVKKYKYPTYFKCVLFGMIALLFSSVFNLALAIGGSTESLFSVGVFGEVSSYLFIAVANAQFIPKEEEERKFHISAWGILAVVALLAILTLSIVFNQSIGNIIMTVLYALATIPCAYYCICTAVNKYKNPFKKGVAPFNVFATLYIVAGAGQHLSLAIGEAGLWVPVFVSSIALGAIAVVVSVILLRKGLEPWQI